MNDLEGIGHLHGEVYGQGDQYFKPDFLPLLVADTLVVKLPEILAQNPLIPEIDDYDLKTTVFHVGSIRLILTEAPHHCKVDVFSLQLISHARGRDCVGITFTCKPEGLHVDYIAVANGHGLNIFSSPIMITVEHLLYQQLMKLYPIFKVAIQDSLPLTNFTREYIAKALRS